MMRKTSIAGLAIIFLVLFLSASTPLKTAHAALANLYIYPGTTSATLGSNFIVNLEVNNVENLYGYDVEITFNKTVLSCVSVSVGSSFPTYLTFETTINNAVGYIRYAVTLVAPEPPLTGNGILLNVQFNPIMAGASSLTLSSVELLNSSALPIPCFSVSGYVTVTGGPVSSAWHTVEAQTMQLHSIPPYVGWHGIESWTGNVNSETNPYFYSFHGPFLETGVAYSGLINVTVSFSDQAPLKFSMVNGQDYSFSSQHQASSVFWNLTADYAHTRQISFGSGYSDEVYLYVGGSGDILSAYSISVTDFAGLSNATLEADKNVLGVNRVVERQSLDVVNNMNFYLVMYSQYTLKLVSDQGTFTWSLPADSVVSKSFVVTMDMVSQVNSALNMTVSATRLNATSARVYFNDPNQTTTSITANIYARNATGQYLFYTQTDLGYSQNFTVYTLAAATNYVATITTAQGLSWTIPLSTLPSSTSIWGVSFDVFGDWTYLAKNGIGMFIVMTLISIGSWKDTEWFLAAGIVVAAFMVYIGMLSVPWAGISAALLVVVLMYIDKGKKEIVYS